MTFRIVDLEPEAQLVELGERLSAALSKEQLPGEPLDLDPDYVSAAKTMLATLSSQIATLPSGIVILEQSLFRTLHG